MLNSKQTIAYLKQYLNSTKLTVDGHDLNINFVRGNKTQLLEDISDILNATTITIAKKVKHV